MNALKAVGMFFGLLAGIFALIVIVMAFDGALRWVAAPFQGAVDAREKITSGNSRIQAYNHFHELCGVSQSYQDQIRYLEEALNKETDEAAASRLSTELRGLRGQLSRAVHRYNAQASEEYTRARFLDSDLPYHLDTRETIQCNH